MKMYTNIDQTAKLVEMGFKKPNGLEFLVRERDNPNNAQIVQRMAYSIGELIEMLPLHIFPNKVCFDLKILANQNWWVVEYTNLFYDEFHCSYSKELIDALYDMIVKLKEEGVI